MVVKEIIVMMEMDVLLVNASVMSAEQLTTVLAMGIVAAVKSVKTIRACPLPAGTV